MNESDALVSVEQRLSQQLHGLIDLTAELTKRLLAAEERLLALETAPDAKPAGEQLAVQQLLDEGQQQVRHLHLLLNPEAELPAADCVDQPEADLPVMEELPDQEHTAFLEEEQHHPEEEALLEDDDDSQMPLLSA